MRAAVVICVAAAALAGCSRQSLEDRAREQAEKVIEAMGDAQSRALAQKVTPEEVKQAQEKIVKLEAELSALKQGQNTTPASVTGNQKLDALTKENAQLKQELQSEQLKAGAIQAQAAELRNQLSRGDAGARDGAANDSTVSDAAVSTGYSGWFTSVIGFVCIIIGLIGGACYMDWYSRQRHGGFRIW